MSFIDARVVSTPDGKKLSDKIQETDNQLSDTAKYISQFSGINDLQKLQSAIDSIPPNGNLILKQGEKYVISGQLNLKSNITIDANGAIITQTLSNTPIFSGVDVSNVNIYNAILNGHGNDFIEAGGRVAVGVYIKGSTAFSKNIIVKNCEFNNFTHAGVYLEKTQGFKINNNIIKGTGATHLVAGTNYQFGITAYIDCHLGEMKNNEISFVAQGIYCSHEQTDTVLEGNIITDVIGQHGMYIANATNMKIVKNTFSRIAYHGIKIQLDAGSKSLSKNTIVSDNILDTIGIWGVSFDNTDTTSPVENRKYFENIQLNNNIVINASGGGFSIRYCKDVKMSNNLYKGEATTTSYGLFLKNVQNATIQNNTFDTMGWSGIYFDGDTAGVLSPSANVTVINNIVKEHGQLGSSSHSGLYILRNYPNLILDGNIVSDSNNVSYKNMFFVDAEAALTTRIRNNIFKDRGIRFNSTVTAILEYDNNDCNDVMGFPSTVKRGRRATVYSGTVANAPTSTTGYVNGDRYEYTDPVAGGYIGKILVSGVWKDFGQISL